MAEKSFQKVRLDSWKSIAVYLGRSSRTAQRWHSEYGLPVRHLGGDRGSIFAYADELDTWLRNRGFQSPDSFEEADGSELLQEPSLANGTIRRDQAVDSPLTPLAMRRQSSELVAHAERMWKTLSNSNLAGITRLFRDAIDLDSTNAAAFAGLSLSLVTAGLLGNLHARHAFDSAEASLEIAFQLDSELVEAKCALAWLKMLRKHDWPGARRDFEEVLSDCPSSQHAAAGRGMLHIAEGSLADASSLLREVSMRSPLSTLALALHAWSKYLGGEYRRALAQVADARTSGHSGSILDEVEALAATQSSVPGLHVERLEILAAEAPDRHLLRGALGCCYALAGRTGEARRILEDLANSSAQEGIDIAYPMALVLAGLGEDRFAIEWIEKSFREESFWSLGLTHDPAFASLHQNPDFKLLLSRLGYPDAEISTSAS